MTTNKKLNSALKGISLILQSRVTNETIETLIKKNHKQGKINTIFVEAFIGDCKLLIYNQLTLKNIVIITHISMRNSKHQRTLFTKKGERLANTEKKRANNQQLFQK